MKKRIEELDVIRGYAIFGILVDIPVILTPLPGILTPPFWVSVFKELDGLSILQFFSQTLAFNLNSVGRMDQPV